jgi:trigger factor
VPGFRKGKVPPQLVVQRIGREAILDEAVRGGLGRWYVDAIDAAGIVPIGDPQLDVGDLPEQGQPLTFSIEIGVRPKAQLGTYRGVEVGRPDAEPDEEAVEAEIAALRDRHARLEPAERPARTGDFLTIDYEGRLEGEEEPFAGGEGRDQVVELGSGRLIPGFEEQLEGASAGDEVAVEVTFPDEYQAEHLAGKPARFAVTVKEVKEKLLPDLDDEFAADAAGFDTLDELREDARSRLRERQEAQIEEQFRAQALDAAVEEATVDVPDSLVEARAREMWENMIHSLSHQGISREAYLGIAQKSEEELVEEARPEAEKQLRREAVVEAIVEAEGLEVSDEEVLEALTASAQREGTTPKKLRDRLRSANRLGDIEENLRARKAIELVAAEAKAIPMAEAEAKGKLWTPEAEAAGAPSGQLWTPGS